VEGVPTAAYLEPASSRVELVVNFGILAAREVSRTEVGTLAEVLLQIVGSATVFTGRRYEFATGAADVAGSEIRIWFPPHTLPEDEAERDALLARVLAEVDRWARTSAAHPPAEGEGLISRIIRGPADR
jgi:hypothetical protein